METLGCSLCGAGGQRPTVSVALLGVWEKCRAVCGACSPCLGKASWSLVGDKNLEN